MNVQEAVLKPMEHLYDLHSYMPQKSLYFPQEPYLAAQD